MRSIKFLFFTIFLLSFTVSNHLQAQRNKSANNSSSPKFGYVAADQIILLMPETRDIDSLLRRYKADSIDAILPYIISEFNRKDSIAKVETNSIIKAQTEKEAAQLRQQLENWNQIAQSKIQEKQNILLAPLYQRVSTAISDLAKEENYLYIFRAESLLYAPEGDNLSEKILKKLGIEIPPGLSNNRPN